MKIYVEERDMPKNCMNCPCGAVYFVYSCKAEQKEFEKYPFDSRQDWCPLVPVPEHGRLGDLDKLEQMFVDIDNAPYSGFDGSEPFYSAEDAARIIRLAPTVIPESGMEGEA